jgi:CRP-like cAMP-binding protein
VLGLNATISNHPYEVTAEMMEPGQANFIASDALLKFVHDYGEVALRVAQELSHNYYSAHDVILTLGLTNPRGKGLPNCCWAGLRNGEIQTILYTCIWC